MRLTASLISLSLLLIPTVAFADGGFEVIVLGALGGIPENNLSSLLIRPHGNRNAVASDAGSLVNGLKVAHESGTFRDVKVPEGSTDSVSREHTSQRIREGLGEDLAAVWKDAALEAAQARLQAYGEPEEA